MVIDRLKKENEELKAKLAGQSFENLNQKIDTLESQLKNKDAELADMKNLAGNKDENDIRTRLIIMQSKVRQAEQKVTALEAEKVSLESKVKRQDTQAAGSASSEQVDVLKRQLRQEMESNEKLRKQVDQLCQEDPETENIRGQLAAAQAQLKSGGGGGGGAGGGAGASAGDIAKFKQELASKDKMISDLQRQLAESASSPAGGGGNSPISVMKLQREIAQLKSTIEMLKKNEHEMKNKYSQAMKKDEFADY